MASPADGAIELDLAFSTVAPAPLNAATCHQLLRQWLGTLQPLLPPQHRATTYSLGLSFIDDSEMAALNQTWRNRSGPTDVLAFAAAEAAPPPPANNPLQERELGDILVSLPTASRQAQASAWTLKQELSWLISHGLLHLLGWDHPDDTRLRDMLRQQIRLLEAAGLLQPSEHAKVWPSLEQTLAEPGAT